MIFELRDLEAYEGEASENRGAVRNVLESLVHGGNESALMVKVAPTRDEVNMIALCPILYFGFEPHCASS